MLSAAGEVYCHCGPGELSITRWLWNIITSGHHIVPCRVPPGSQLSLSPVGYEIISKFTLIVHQGNPITPVGYEILSLVDWSLFNGQCPRGNQLALCPMGNSISPVGPDILSAVDIILFNVKCPRGRFYSHFDLGELSITSWPWHIITSEHHIVQCGVPPGKSTAIVPQWNSVSPVGPEIASLVDIILFNVECPRGSQLVLFPRGIQCHQLAMTYYHQWTGCLCSVPPRKSIVIVPPGELSITSWLWNSITSGLAILFNTECPRTHCAIGELRITSWLWNIVTKFNGHIVLVNVECPGEKSVIVPQGNLVSSDGHEILSPVDIMFNVACPRGRVHSYCAPRELSITSWPWHIITSGHHIVQYRVPLGKSLLSLCSRGTAYHQLAMACYHQ